MYWQMRAKMIGRRNDRGNMNTSMAAPVLRNPYQTGTNKISSVPAGPKVDLVPRDHGPCNTARV